MHKMELLRPTGTEVWVVGGLQILVEGGRATGVQLRSGGVIRAHKAVVTNASVWDTQTLLPSGAVSSKARWATEQVEDLSSVFATCKECSS